MGFGACNLVLVCWAEHAKTRAHLERIAALVPKFGPQVRTQVVVHHKRDQLRLIPLWFQPTLSVSFLALNRRKLLPGRVTTGIRIYKHGEYARLDAAGIPVPKWTLIEPGMRLDPAEWGPYVVEKPAAGRRGANVRIRRTGRMRHVPSSSLPADHYGRQAPMLAQQFIYTGEWPSSYRVVTMFGHVLLCYHQVSQAHGAPLTSRWNFRATGGHSIVSNTRDMKATLVKEADVIALAERAHRTAFPALPVLSFDIIRDAESGALYVLECHSAGSWMFTADMGHEIEVSNGIDFERQFGATERAAEILAAITPLLAERSWPFRAGEFPQPGDAAWVWKG
jgi:hypothetical protein